MSKINVPGQCCLKYKDCIYYNLHPPEGAAIFLRALSSHAENRRLETRSCQTNDLLNVYLFLHSLAISITTIKQGLVNSALD